MSQSIKVKKLVKRYKKSKSNAVDNISFDVKTGEFFAFLGPNGAGKTTTISILTTTLAMTAGSVEIAGYDIEKNSSDVRKSIGVIFQKPSLDENLTAEENIRLHANLYGLYPFRPAYRLMPFAYKERVLELANILGIKDNLNSPVKTFSGGMKRKLEIVRSLMHKPKVLFLDEPTSGLDPQSRRNLWRYIKEVQKNEGTTIFLTTHYLEEAEGSDRVAIINKGKIITLGTPQKIKRELVKNYILVDAAKRKELENELSKKKIDYTIDEDGVKIDIKDKNVQDIIQKIKTRLSVLETHTPTLEDAYLDIIETSNGVEEK